MGRSLSAGKAIGVRVSASGVLLRSSLLMSRRDYAELKRPFLDCIGLRPLALFVHLLTPQLNQSLVSAPCRVRRHKCGVSPTMRWKERVKCG
jgi:hypothetical protein